ncbi:aspartate kinase [Thermoactinospora rubra]|uniref:amino acid kinase family protein n=1 Tax=Thermoactinospora rubra TaxID=1088767 RepID=UPI000A0FB962|nr:aspartate kinase [Thermoactinospora rubra]
MSTAVLKFGGSSFPGPAAYRTVAEHLAERVAAGERLVVTVSAAPGETEQLRRRLHEVTARPGEATVAGLLTLADTISAHLLAGALGAAGRSAVVLAGHQMGFVTAGSPMWARLERMDRGPLEAALAEHEVVLLPGGQAVDAAGRPTWLGKNSSDLTAIAAASALGVSRCEIYSDVDGVYTADPRLVPEARLVPEISYDTVGMLSLRGARVLHGRAVRMAHRHGVAIVCRANRPPFASGTVITESGAPVAAVVVNPSSMVVRFPTTLDSDRAHAAFSQAGIEALRLDSEPVVVIANGHVDAEGFLADHDLPGKVTKEIPVTEVDGGATRTHLAPGIESGVELARELHRKLVTERRKQ